MKWQAEVEEVGVRKAFVDRLVLGYDGPSEDPIEDLTWGPNEDLIVGLIVGLIEDPILGVLFEPLEVHLGEQEYLDLQNQQEQRPRIQHQLHSNLDD